MTLADLADYKGEWVEAAASNYHGYDVFESPLPSQAWGANETPYSQNIGPRLLPLRSRI
jgi:hypothetical protein